MGALTDDMTRLNDEVNALRNARHEFLNEQRAFVQRSREDVASMRTRTRADNTARAVNVQEELATNETERAAEAQRFQNVRMDFLSEVRGRAGEIRAGANHLMIVLRSAHAERAAEQRELRCASEAARVEEARQSSSARADFVDALRTGVSRLRGEVAAEMAGARRAWGGAITSQEAKAKRPLPVKVDQKSEDKGTKTASVLVRERTMAEQRPAEKAADTAPDDLTGISGIGRTTQEHLNDAGIHTYAQLAACNPGYLRTILEGSGRRGNVEEWIAEAAKLAKAESRAHRG